MTKSMNWSRFGIRFLLLVVTLVGIWLGVASSQARSQKKAVQQVSQLHGSAIYGYRLDEDMKWEKDPKPAAPAWLVKLVGHDYFGSVWVVNFDDGSDPSDADLKCVAHLKELRQLTLKNRKKISDEGLRHIAKLNKLEVLAINGTNVSGEGLSHLKNCRRLKGLPISDTPLTDVGLSHISHLKELEWLQLSRTNVTDEGLRHISGLYNLESLQLVDTRITDEGLKHLSSLESLKRVLLRGTKTTQAARTWLQNELPNCSVSY